ncbi:MAG: hypothetical protein LQ350_001193 [Teloschistes chrysophthalmus]|nr:MAG: hypothetical protein LQ350_001193 [Niorma chrysophthalma]
MSNILVTSASGNIGKPLIPLLLKSTSIKKIMLPTTNAARLSSQIPTSDRITVLEGSIQDPAWIEEVFVKHGIDTVFLNLTGTDELFTTCNLFSSILRSQCVKHLIYLSACGDMMPESVFHERFGGIVPGHVLVKTAVEQLLRQSKPWREGGRTWTILGPSLFFTNDLRGKEGMVGKAGVFGEPLGGMGVSRVDVEDIALAVVRVAEGPEKWSGKKIMVGSKETYTDVDVGKLWSEALGKKITVAPNNAENLDRLEKHIGGAMRPEWGRDIRMMYELFEKIKFAMSDQDYEMQKELLGKEPSSYEEFVKRTGAEWKKEIESAQ